jgi:hypothetical protein
MTLCSFAKVESHGDRATHRCLRCGYVTPSIPDRGQPIYRECHGAPGIGDMLTTGLAACGITKQRVSGWLGFDCGCERRQDALNRLGWWIVERLR